MVKVKQSILVMLSCVMMLMLGVCMFVACGSKDYTVTFMIQSDPSREGGWLQYGNAVEVTDGKVELPEQPSKDYYSFRGWYTTQTFDADCEFKNEGIKSNLTVYAYFAADQVNVVVDGKDQGRRNIVDIIGGEWEVSEGLDFDGWYTDAQCSTRFVAGDKVTTVYGQSVAIITFDNGYEEVFSAKVRPGDTMNEPSLQDVQRNYMSDKDISYLDEKGEKIDFSSYTFSSSITVTVLWRTPYLKYNDSGVITGVDETAEDGQFYLRMGSLPAVSILSDFTDESGKKVHAEAISGVFYSNKFPEVHTVIVGEGIKSVSKFFTILSDYPTPWKIEKIILPSTLRIIDNSFNGLADGPEVELPDGLEVLIGSFFGVARTEYPDIDIAVPDSVKVLSRVPANLTFKETSCFYKDAESRIFKRDTRGDILICDYNVKNGVLSVPEGVKGIQVGAFYDMELDYLILPSTWEYVNYNPDVSEYPYFYTVHFDGSYPSQNENPFWNEDYVGTTFVDNWHGSAVCIFNGLENTKVVVAASALPEGVASYTLLGKIEFSYSQAYYDYTYSQFEGQTIFSGNVPEGEDVEVSVYLYNRMTDISETKKFAMVSGQTLTHEKLFEEIGFSAEEDKIRLNSMKQFEVDYSEGSIVRSNLYIEIDWEYITKGYTYRENGDGTVSITGFDRASAYLYAETNCYIVSIPEEIGGKKVAEIADNAFKDNELISHVIISNTVKRIGASAFENTSNMTRVLIIPGGLEEIGEAAFRGSGLTSVALPLSRLNSVGAYAFKSRSLVSFLAVEGEENRVLFSEGSGRNAVDYEGLTEGMFFIQNGVNLIRFVSKTLEKQPVEAGSQTMNDVWVYDVQLIATCGGAGGSWSSYNLGYSGRLSSSSGVRDAVMRFEVMTGSVYYLDNYGGEIVFAIVSKIHVNAFTDMSADFLGPDAQADSRMAYYEASEWAENYEKYVDAEKIRTMDPTIFEDGWWEGVTSSSDGEAAAVYAWLCEAMSNAQQCGWMW